MHPDAHTGERAPGHLFVQHRLMPEIAAGAAPFLGGVDAQKAELAGAPPQFMPDMPALTRLLVLRLHLGVDKTHPRIAEALDLRVVPRALEFDRHARDSLSAGVPPHPAPGRARLRLADPAKPSPHWGRGRVRGTLTIGRSTSAAPCGSRRRAARSRR